MFPGYPSTSGSGKIVGRLKSSDPAVNAVIAEGWPSLLEAMTAAGLLDTPARTAAFLTTLVHESGLRYNRRQNTQDRVYYGRGYIQLTGRATDPDANGNVMNYTDAGKYLGINMVATPEEVAAGNFAKPDLALDLRYSARIAIWYWTVARPKCNEYADALRMGMINAAIGYPRDPAGTNDNDRCMVFAHALANLTGDHDSPIVVDCSRTAPPPPPPPPPVDPVPVYTTSEVQGVYVAAPDLWVHNNVHKPTQAGPQTLTVYSWGRWKVVAAHNKHLTDPAVSKGAIKAYPCSRKNYTNRPIDSFTVMRADWATRHPAYGDGEWIGAYDNWVGPGVGSKCTAEVMIWTHHCYNGPLPPSSAQESTTVFIDGKSFVAWRRPLNNLGTGQQYIALALQGDGMKPTGSLDLLAVFKWLVSKGWLKGTDPIAAIEYGWELAHNNGKTQEFWVDKFELIDT